METVARPAPWNLSMYQGDTFDLKLTLSVDGVPLDLTTAVVKSAITDSKGTVQATFSTVEQRADGFLHIQLTGEQTQNLVDGIWDLQVELNGVTKTFLRGKVGVMKDITR